MRLNTAQNSHRGWFVQEKFGALKLFLYYPNLVINFVVEAMTWSHVTQPNNNIYVSTSHPHNEIEIHACMFWNCCCKNSSTFNPYSSPAGTGNVFSTSLNNPQIYLLQQTCQTNNRIKLVMKSKKEILYILSK